jgi:VanZ family protein
LAARPLDWRLIGLVLLVAAGYGILDELTQALVGRSADIKDWFADLVGATAGIWAALLAHWLGRRILAASRS